MSNKGFTHAELRGWFREIEGEQFPDVLGIIPLKNAVLLPGGVLSITAGREKTLALPKKIDTKITPVGIATQRSPEMEDPQFEDLYDIGTVGRIIKIQRVDANSFLLIVHGLTRVKLDHFTRSDLYWEAAVSPVEELGQDTIEAREMSRAVK